MSNISSSMAQACGSTRKTTYNLPWNIDIYSKNTVQFSVFNNSKLLSSLQDGLKNKHQYYQDTEK